MYLNKVLLYGNLTSDPELRSLPSGAKVASFGLATNRTFKDKDGNKKEDVQFHNVVSFGKPAELIAQYMKKGRPLYLEGRLQTRSWDDKTSGAKKYRTEVIIDTFQFGPSAPGTSGAGSFGGAKAEPSVQSPVADKAPMDTIEYPSEEINPEDIPF